MVEFFTSKIQTIKVYTPICWSRFHFCPFEGVCPCVHTVCQINSVNCKAVGAYRIRPPWRRKWMFDGGNVFAAIVFIFAHLRAYAIRPYTCSINNVLVVYSPQSFRFRSHQGVCDTPLRLFDEKHRSINRKNRTFAVIFSNHHGLTDARRKPSLLRVLASIRNIPIIFITSNRH